MVSIIRARKERKILWISLAIFGFSGILPWFIAKFPVGHLTVSIYDIGTYFFQTQQFPIELYSNLIYGGTIAYWIFSVIFLGVATLFVRKKLLLYAGLIIIVPSMIWTLIMPFLDVQMIFLNLSNQQLMDATGQGVDSGMLSREEAMFQMLMKMNVEQGPGPGMFTAIIAGAIVIYNYFLIRREK